MRRAVAGLLAAALVPSAAGAADELPARGSYAQPLSIFC